MLYQWKNPASSAAVSSSSSSGYMLLWTLSPSLPVGLSAISQFACLHDEDVSVLRGCVAFSCLWLSVTVITSSPPLPSSSSPPFWTEHHRQKSTFKAETTFTDRQRRGPGLPYPIVEGFLNYCSLVPHEIWGWNYEQLNVKWDHHSYKLTQWYYNHYFRLNKLRMGYI